MEIQPIKNFNTFFDYIPSNLSSGMTIEEITSIKTDISEKFTTSFRQLVKIGMTESVGTLVEEVGSNTTYNVSSETEFNASFEKSYQATTEHTIKVGYPIPPNCSFGTIIGVIRFIFGGITFDVTTTYHLNFWDANTLIELKNSLVTTNLDRMLRGYNTNHVPYTVIDNDKIVVQPVLALPFKGKTCNQESSFGGPCNNPSHHVDNSNVVVLDGTEFVVCWHHNFKWFGGPGCNCDHIDNKNVIRVKAVDLDKAYAFLSSSEGK